MLHPLIYMYYIIYAFACVYAAAKLVQIYEVLEVPLYIYIYVTSFEMICIRLYMYIYVCVYRVNLELTRRHATTRRWTRPLRSWVNPRGVNPG